MARIVVVGAGFGGLATAVRLADLGHEVMLCEQHDSVGGLLRGAANGGARIELAPGPIPLPAVLRDLFGKTGRPLDRVLNLVPAEPAFCYRFSDGRALDLPNTSRAGIARALDDAFGAGSGAAWQGVVDDAGAVWAAVRSPYLTAAPTRSQRFAARVSHGRRRRLGVDRTLRSLTATMPPPLGSMLEHRAAGVDPRRAPAGLAAIAYVQQTFGRWYIRGGPSHLAAALHDRAAERGVKVLTSTPVTGIESSGRRVTGVRLPDGGLLGADAVVAAVDSARVLPDLMRDTMRTRRARQHSPGRFTLTLALDPPLHGPSTGRGGEMSVPDVPGEDPPSHTVLLSPDPDAAVDALHGDPARPPESPTIDVHSTPDGSRMTVCVIVPAHGVDVDWTAPGAADDYADRIVAVLAERGLDVRDRIRWRHVHTPADTADETGAAGGREFGPAITDARDIAARSNLTRLRGFYHVGRSAYPGPGIPLVGASATIVADLIGRA